MSPLLPPYADSLGIALDPSTNGDNTPTLIMPFSEKLLGRPGFLHGGAIGGLLEIAAIVALHHMIDLEGQGQARPVVKPVNVTIDFMRGGRDKATRAIGIVTRLGTRVANVEAIAWQDARDRPIAGARMNYLLSRQAD